MHNTSLVGMGIVYGGFLVVLLLGNCVRWFSGCSITCLNSGLISPMPPIPNDATAKPPIYAVNKYY
jgi:hypothetical protein